MKKIINNPVVLVHKRENSDTYAVAVTEGSQDYLDAMVMVSMEPDMNDENIGAWSQAGYYMAAEIENLRRLCEHLRSNLAILAVQQNAPQNIPEIIPDWKLVPVEPTRQMMSQGHFAMAGTDRGKFRRIYQAMVKAAPEVKSES